MNVGYPADDRQAYLVRRRAPDGAFGAFLLGFGLGFACAVYVVFFWAAACGGGG